MMTVGYFRWGYQSLRRWGLAIFFLLAAMVPAQAKDATPAATSMPAIAGADASAVVAGPPATRAPAAGVAMQGVPKYGADFSHLAYVNPDAPKGGELRQAVVGSFDSLNPFSIKGTVPLGLSQANYVYDSLMSRSWDEPFSLYGLIAQSIELPPDRSFIIFHLNPKARFQDGQPITADDVLFSWQTLRDKGRPNHRAYYSRVETATKLDPLSVKFTFRRDADGQIDRELPLILGLMPILPEHYWASRDIRLTTLDPPVGSGPYRVAAVDPGRSITYERVKDYWAKDLPICKGLYNFDRIRFDYFRDDSIALEAFNAGSVNFRREMDPTKWEKGYANRPDIERLAFPHHRPEAVRAYIYNMRRPLFANEKFREALGEAFDFEWMNRAFFYGLYHRTESYFPNSELAATGLPQGDELALLEPYAKQLPPALFTQAYELPKTDGSGPVGIRPNLRRAVELLKEAGFTYRDEALIDPATGQPVSFEILLGDRADERITLEWVRTLARLGIQAHIRTVDSAQFQDRLNTYDYDVVLFRWINSLSPGNEQRIFWGSQAADQPGSRNYAGLKDPVVDALISHLLTTTDRAAFVAGAKALDRVLLWHNLSLPLYYAGADWLAWHAPLAHPDVTPLYGPVIEAWWSAKEQAR